MTAEELSDGTVSKTMITKLLLSKGQDVESLWVFDTFTIVRTTNKEVIFFKKPLIEQFTSVPMSMDYNNFTDYQN